MTVLWNVQSYVGANRILFGMSPDEVAKQLGVPEATRDDGDLQIAEFRGVEDPVVHYDGGGVSELIFSKYTLGLRFGDVLVFQEQSLAVLKYLTSLTDDLREGAGTIFSLKLGVSMSGFQDEDDESKSLGAFTKGVWDGRVAKSRPLKL